MDWRHALTGTAIWVGLAGPAIAQPSSFESEALRVQQEAIQRRMIDLESQLQAQDGRRRADEAALAVRLQQGPVRAPNPPFETAYAAGDAAPAYPSIPDGVLAQSNQRVRDAAANRR